LPFLFAMNDHATETDTSYGIALSRCEISYRY
jgi:hypothetical protein